MIGHVQVTAVGAGAVAIGRDNFGTVTTHVSYAGRPPVSWPHRVGVVPPVAAGYLPRTDPGVDLDRVLREASGTAVLTGVVSGMGGVGKTQLAAAYAHRLWDAHQLDLLMWLTATSRDAIVTGYAQAGEDVAHPVEGDDTEQVAARFLAWLAATDKRWMVVLDDLVNPADLRGLWPQGRTGRVLVTTRRRDAALADRGTIIDVDLFTEAEATAYLTGRLNADGRHPERLAEAGELAEDLGRLPLALAHAAAYILDQQPLTCAGYRKLLAEQQLKTALPATSGNDYASTVAVTWALSVALASRLPPTGLAGALLTLAAVLDPHGIPTGLFTTKAARAYLSVARGPAGATLAVSGHRTAQRAEVMSTVPRRGGLLRRLLHRSSAPVFPPSDVAAPMAVEDVEFGLRNLHRLSLVTLTWDQEKAGAGSVLVHALVMRATREQARPPNLEAVARTAADALLQAWPEQDYQPEHALLTQSLRDNTDVLARAATTPLWCPGAHQVLFRAGRSRTDGGLIAQAVAYWATLTATAERILGPEHPDTLASRSALAGAYRDAGRLAEAVPLFERTLADRERLLGADHPDTLTSRNNLAYAYRAAGRLVEAVPLYESTLADRQRILGADHPDTLTSRAGLAGAYQDAGRLAEAVRLHERTLADRERLLGADHPDTLTSRNNLAYAYRAAGRLVEAVPLYESTLADRQRILGPDHPHTLGSRNNLADAYQAAGRLVEALRLHERTLADRERLMGADHPATLASRNNLADAYRAAGRLAEAVPLYESTLADAERLLGLEHPDTLTIRNNVAYAYRLAGRLAEAVPLFECTLAGRERLLGADHPDTLASRANLADAYRAAGRPAEAVPLFERSLAGRERLLGADHPDTLASRAHLADAYRAAGRPAEAVRQFERTLADAERLLGLDHPATLTSRNNLADAYRAAGRLAEAVPLYERTVGDAERLLGPAHPQLALALCRLGQAQAKLGNLASAAAAFGRAVEVDTAAYGPQHPEIAPNLEALAAVLEQQGQPKEGAAARARAQRIRDLEQRYGPDAEEAGSSHPGTEPR